MIHITSIIVLRHLSAVHVRVNVRRGRLPAAVDGRLAAVFGLSYLIIRRRATCYQYVY